MRTRRRRVRGARSLNRRPTRRLNTSSGSAGFRKRSGAKSWSGAVVSSRTNNPSSPAPELPVEDLQERRRAVQERTKQRAEQQREVVEQLHQHLPEETPAADGFSWDASDNVYERQMEAQRLQIEATKQQAEALQQQAVAAGEAAALQSRRRRRARCVWPVRCVSVFGIRRQRGMRYCTVRYWASRSA